MATKLETLHTETAPRREHRMPAHQAAEALMASMKLMTAATAGNGSSGTEAHIARSRAGAARPIGKSASRSPARSAAPNITRQSGSRPAEHDLIPARSARCPAMRLEIAA